MTADAEPCDFVLFQKSDDTVCAGNTHRVDRVSVVDLLELKAGMVRVVAKDEGSAASRAISQLLGVQYRGSASRGIGAALRLRARSVHLRVGELAGPVLFISEPIEQPTRNPILSGGRLRTT